MNTSKNILSVNLEDYFQVAPMRQIIPPKNWSRFELRIEGTTLRTLDLLDRFDQKATFFVLGWLSERCPDLIREVVRRGHSVASKGYLHRRYSQLSLTEFETDLKRSQDAIGNAIGESVSGYRIAEGSLPTDDMRPFEILARGGVQYDSSVRPFGLAFARKQDWQGIRSLSGKDWSLTEVPLSSHSVLGIPVPMTGGNYMRQVPEALYKHQLNSFLKSGKGPWHLYFHVWELDPAQPRVSATTRMGRLRQYRNLEQMQERLEALLGAYKFSSIEEYLGISPKPFEVKAAMPAQAAQTLSSADARTKATIVVPCYNEEDSLPYLAKVLDQLAADNAETLSLSYIFVDDGSKDRTWEQLERLFGSRPDCKIIKHAKNQGIAAATMTGIRNATDEIICGIDCDCSFDPQELPKMIPLLKPDVDMVQASPYHQDGGVLNVPEWRLLLSKGCSRLYSIVLRHKFASYTACFRIYRRSSIQNIELTNGGFMGIMEMFVLLDRSGAKIVEYPAVLETRLLGISKMKTLSVIKSHLGMLWELVWNPQNVAKRANKSVLASGRMSTPGE